MNIQISTLIRSVLTLALIYMTYGETGPWAAFSLVLIFLAIEVNVLRSDNHTRDISDLERKVIILMALLEKR